MEKDPRDILNTADMARLQIMIVGITIGLNALDGFDILSISFASPGIAAEWGISRGALGIVLSMELIGMGLGSFLLGSVADKFGRRPTTLGCLMLMSLGMFMVTATSSIVTLSFWRIVTGVGIGGILTCLNALVAEYTNNRRRHLCISLMAIGYPIGGVIGGSIASGLLAVFDWRAVFYFGAAVTAFFIPVVYFMIPESVHWLVRKQPRNALERINHTMRRLGHTAISRLPHVTEESKKKSVADIFSPTLIAVTAIIAVAYFMHIMTFYFILKWVPKIVADMGFAESLAGGVLVWANVGGALGGAIFGVLTIRYDLKLLTVAVLFLSAVFVVVFGRTPENLAWMSFFCALAGFFGNAGIVGLYAIAAQAFPTHARAFGTGFMIGFGRGGSVLSPILAGYLMEFGVTLPGVAIVMAIGSLIGGAVLLFLKLSPDLPSEGGGTPEEEGAKVTLKPTPA